MTSSGADSVIEDLSFFSGGRVVARNCQISVTGVCGHGCLFCPVRPPRRHLPARLVSASLRAYARRENRRLRDTELILTGGEPGLWPGLFGTARLGRGLGFRSVTLLSSAEVFADGRFARAARAAGIGRVFLSLHSHRPKIHDFLTGTKGGFARAVAGIRTCLASGFSHVTCNMVLTRLNSAEIPEQAAFLAGLLRRGSAPLALFLSTMEENPAWANLAAPHSLAAAGAARALREGRLPLMRLMGDWTMPACVGGLADASPALAPLGRRDSRTWYAPAGWTPDAASVPEGFRRVKARSCRGCPLDGACGGLSRVYAGRFGAQELRPVRRAPRAGSRGAIHIV